jgi:hypothetical protein
MSATTIPIATPTIMEMTVSCVVTQSPCRMTASNW